MKYRLVIDHFASTIDPWFQVHKWEDTGVGYWRMVASGYEESTRKIFDRLTAGLDQFEEVSTGLTADEIK